MKVEINKQSTYLKKEPSIIEINNLDDLMDIIDSANCSISLDYSDLPECELEIMVMDNPREFYL